MDNKAIINGKKVKLTEAQVKNAAKFHKERIAFALINNEWKFNEDKNDDRDHQHWVCEDYGLSVDEFENIIRGYMKNNGIYLYTGSDFKEIDLNKLSVAQLNELVAKNKEVYREINVGIYNGVHVGKPGDIWMGKEIVLIVHNEYKEETNNSQEAIEEITFNMDNVHKVFKTRYGKFCWFNSDNILCEDEPKDTYGKIENVRKVKDRDAYKAIYNRHSLDKLLATGNMRGIDVTRAFNKLKPGDSLDRFKELLEEEREKARAFRDNYNSKHAAK